MALARQKCGAAETDEAERATTAQVVGDLRRRLEAEKAGREKLDRRLSSLTAKCDDERKRRCRLEEGEQRLRQELEAAELSLSAQLAEPGRQSEPPMRLLQTTVLYVGGRAHQIAQLRILTERMGGTFLHHDGGIENRSALLEAHVARADVVFFPADCVSHNAVATVKRVSRYAGKSYVALRTSGLTSFAAALHALARQRHSSVAPQPAAILAAAP